MRLRLALHLIIGGREICKLVPEARVILLVYVKLFVSIDPCISVVAI